MNIIRHSIRGVVLYALFLFIIIILRTNAADIEEENEEPQLYDNVDYFFHNNLNVDPLPTTTTNTEDDDYNNSDNFDDSTTTTTTTTTITTITTHKAKTAHVSSTSKSILHKTTHRKKSVSYTHLESTTTTFRPVAAASYADEEEEESTSTESDPKSENSLYTTPTLPASISLDTPSQLPFITASLTPSPSNTTIQYTNTSDPLVQYDLECQADDAFCSKVSRAVGAAIDEFSRVIYVKNSLLIKVRYYSFCEKACANDTYGWGAPTSQFTLPFEDGADLNYVYPQALAKQLAPYSSTSVWAKYDIEIEINHDVYLNGTDIEGNDVQNGKFWFFNDSNGNTSNSHAIQSHQVDFRYVVLHELLHGLGFLSSWAAYFYTDASPFRELVNGVIDPLELQIVTPGPYWYINQNTGPAYVTGFQPTMIFDKYLVSMDTELNVTKTSSLSELAFDMQDFCVQNNDAFIINFIRLFNLANQSTTARKLWLSMSQPETVSFHFEAPTVANSSYNLIPYLNKTYESITLLTGGDLFSSSSFEQTESTLNRPGLVISHLDDQYASTPDFLMTHAYHKGKTLEELVDEYYDTIPVIKYNTTATNNSMVEAVYHSPIGPGVLRILDSIGYSTVLTKTNYTTDGNVKTPKSRSLCDDSNTNHAKPTPSPNSIGSIVPRNLILTTTLIVGIVICFSSLL